MHWEHAKSKEGEVSWVLIIWYAHPLRKEELCGLMFFIVRMKCEAVSLTIALFIASTIVFLVLYLPRRKYYHQHYMSDTNYSYIPMISSLKWIVSFEETSEISSEIAAKFGFFPVNTKMKAQWACAYLPLVKIFHYMYFISLFIFGNLLLLSEDPSQIWNRWKYRICGATIQMVLKRIFTGISLVSAYQSIMTYCGSIQKYNNFTFKESDTHYYGRRECSS